MNDLPIEEPNGLYEGAAQTPLRALTLAYRRARSQRASTKEVTGLKRAARSELLSYMEVEQRHKATLVSQTAKKLAALLPGGDPSPEVSMLDRKERAAYRKTYAAAAELIIEAAALQATAVFAEPHPRKAGETVTGVVITDVDRKWARTVLGTETSRGAAAKAFDRLLAGSGMESWSIEDQKEARTKAIDFFNALIPSADALDYGTTLEL